MTKLRPRVLHVITSLDRGGAEASLTRLIEAAGGVKHIAVVALSGGETPFSRRIEEAGVRVHFFGGLALRSIWPRWRSLIADAQPDVVHAWLIHPALLVSILPSTLPFIIGVRHSLDDLTGEKRRSVAIIRLLAILGRRASRICYVSQASRQQHEAIGYPSDKGVVIPNGYDVQSLPVAPSGAKALRDHLALSQEVKLIGQVARHHPIKGHDLLLRAFANIAREQSDVHLVLMGAETDTVAGPLAVLTSELSIADRVHALGERNDVPLLLSGLDILVNPSRSEAFPNAVAEGMLAGLPCIASDVGDTATILGDHGLLVPQGDIDALEKATLTLLARSRKERLVLGRAARDHVVRLFSLTAMAERYATLYEDVWESHVSRGILRFRNR